MSKDRWENIIGGIISTIIIFLWGWVLKDYLGIWPFGWFWLIIYSIMGGLGYIALMYQFLNDKDKKQNGK